MFIGTKKGYKNGKRDNKKMTETTSRNRHECTVAVMFLLLLISIFCIIGYAIFGTITTGHLPNRTTPPTTFDYIFWMIESFGIEVGIGYFIIFVVSSVKNSRL